MIKPQQALSLRGLSKLKKKVSCFVPTVWLPINMHEKLKKVWFQEVVFYFGFCIEFVIKLLNLLKKIETFLCFEIELVCGFDFFFFFFVFFVLCFVLFVG